MKSYEKVEKITHIGVIALCIILFAFQIYTAAYQPFGGSLQRSIHLGLGLAIAFLTYPLISHNKQKSDSTRLIFDIIGIILAIASLISCGYVAINWFEMAEPMRQIFPVPADYILGTLLFILVFISTVKVCGWAMPIIAVVFCAYALFGKYVPFPALRHPGVNYKQLISMGYLAQEGIFSSMLGVSSTQIFIFLAFGSILNNLHGGEFFLNWANSGFGRKRGGPAKIAVFGSAFFGSISGSAVANVAGTGTITIPMMKRVGYDPHDAGAVEAVASTGGMIMPPVMGSAAFLMSEITGCSYWDVCKCSIIPVALYYLVLYLAVDLKARKKNLKGLPEEEIPKGLPLLKRYGYIYLPPLIILVVCLSVFQLSPNKSCVLACAILLLTSLTKRELREKLRKDWLKIIVDACIGSLTVITACAAAGMILLGLQTSGLITKMSNVLVALSGDNLYILLVLCMLGSIIIGMGLPATESYMLLAILAAPSLVVLGVPKLVAHYYVLFFGNLSAITPPVAMAAFAAAPIAQASGAKIGYKAWRIALPLFLIGYCIPLAPSLCLQGGILEILKNAAFCLLGSVSFAIGLEQYLVHPIALWRSVLYCLGGVLLILPGLVTSLIGLALVVIMFVTEKDSTRFFRDDRLESMPG